MDEKPAARVFSEEEAYAMIAAKVDSAKEESAAIIASLNEEIAALKVELETAQSALAAAEKTAADHLAEFETFKAQLAEEKAKAERASARVAEYRDVAPHLTDEYFTAERVDMLADLSEVAFAEVLSAAKTVATAAARATEDAPVETAMSGEGIAQEEAPVSTGAFLSAVLKKGNN